MIAVILRRLRTNAGIFLAFGALTIIMTWPWVQSLRDYTPDAGDSYLNAWILWWDYHQTFRDPLHLFQANILYPYQYTLAFSEHNYGVALLLFPLFALGLKPVTVYGIAVLAGFAFCGFGSFRLSRTLTGSNAAGWIAGVVFAFVPFRFHHLPHVNYLSAGWIPLTLEALILFSRRSDRKRAAWLGIAFFMNALTCIHWFLLTLIPLGLTGLVLASRLSVWRNRRYWLYGAIAVALASLALLPFLIPYVRVRQLYGFERTRAEVEMYSAQLHNWLMVDWRNKLWHGLGSPWGYVTELALFPGLAPPLLAIAAFRFKRWPSSVSRTRKLAIALETIVVAGLVLAALRYGFGTLQPQIFGIQLFHLTSSRVPLLVSLIALILRIILMTIQLRAPGFRFKWPGRLSEPLEIGLVWTIVGFAGSFGLHFFFHRFLFDHVSLFHSIRVPARWAMICFVGLSVLAAAGATQLIQTISKTQSRYLTVAMYSALAVIIMFEQRSAPLELIHGAVTLDPVIARLRDTPMRGGVVELPAALDQVEYLYMLHATDHAKLTVNGVSGFRPPIQDAVASMSNEQPVNARFADLLEAIPVSYVVVHHTLTPPATDKALRSFFDQGVAAGRFRLVARFGENASADDLYLVTRTEPDFAEK